MTDKDFFIYTLGQELPRFLRVLEALESIPVKNLSYKPDEKSKSGLEIAKATLGNEPGMIALIAKAGDVDMMSYTFKEFESIADVTKEFKKSIKSIEKIVSEMKPSEWNKKAQMRVGEHVEWETTRGKMVWELFLDLIHHRGQITTYLRPMGGYVPSIYGPSADRPNAAAPKAKKKK